VRIPFSAGRFGPRGFVWAAGRSESRERTHPAKLRKSRHFSPRSARPHCPILYHFVPAAVPNVGAGFRVPPNMASSRTGQVTHVTYRLPRNGPHFEQRLEQYAGKQPALRPIIWPPKKAARQNRRVPERNGTERNGPPAPVWGVKRLRGALVRDPQSSKRLVRQSESSSAELR
jgi:hypothetical protein